ncbi:MAG: exodeoxyribonuclease III [Myxococcota bacterium]
MKLVTWNVNSIKAREERALAWVKKHEPDVLCLQELKVVTEKFPYDAFRELGYEAAVNGQKTYNGVAILSRLDMSDVVIGMPDDAPDEQARVISAEVEGIRVIDVYVPNGSTVGSDKWRYKLAWFERLFDHLESNHDPDAPIVLCGDFNIAPDDHDVARPEEWSNSVLCHPDARSFFRRLVDWGFEDTFRKHHPDGGVYSWWDYRQLGFPKGNGLRIDHILATGAVEETSRSGAIDREERKGKQPSDHAPVIVDFDW